MIKQLLAAQAAGKRECSFKLVNPMACIVSVVFKGISVQSAHASIGDLTISQDKARMSFMVQYRTSAESEQFDAQHVSAPFDIEGKSPFAQAYEYIKNLPQFEGATDY